MDEFHVSTFEDSKCSKPQKMNSAIKTINSLNSTDVMNQTVTNSSTIVLIQTSTSLSNNEEAVIVLVMIVVMLLMMAVIMGLGQKAQSTVNANYQHQNSFLGGSMYTVNEPAAVVDYALDIPPTYSTCVLSELGPKGGPNGQISDTNQPISNINQPTQGIANEPAPTYSSLNLDGMDLEPNETTSVADRPTLNSNGNTQDIPSEPTPTYSSIYLDEMDLENRGTTPNKTTLVAKRPTLNGNEHTTTSQDIPSGPTPTYNYDYLDEMFSNETTPVDQHKTNRPTFENNTQITNEPSLAFVSIALD